MKFDLQVQALKAIAVASNFGRRPVGAEEIAPRLGVASSTAGLNNRFFHDAGLIQRSSKGKYVPVQDTIDFAQRHSFSEDTAGEVLGPLLEASWFYEEVRTQLAMGPASREQMVEVLAYAAGASRDRQIQLNSLISWLEYARLVAVHDNGDVSLVSPPAGPPAQTHATPPDAPVSRAAAQTDPPVASTRREQAHVQSPTTVLSLDLSLSIDATQLAALNPEQIASLFEAVGRVAAVKAGFEST